MQFFTTLLFALTTMAIPVQEGKGAQNEKRQLDALKPVMGLLGGATGGLGGV